MITELKFEQVGGHPLIDLVNTKIMRNGKPFEQLATAQDVLAWCEEVGLLEENATEFSAQEESHLLAQVRQFREQMRQMLAEIVAGRAVVAETIEVINELLQHWQGQPQLIEVNGTFVRKINYNLTQDSQLLGLLADTAAHFVAEVDFRYVKRCDNPQCVRYFLDTSRNHSRRWCSMAGCGNRIKARAHYARRNQ